ncbi:uncharacterized protein LOC113093992 [Carassius auratus]|uniref:Uncharacterized protein LOC113093992 n=1 Tax=Carassius auratus TaxID=7957 RepID=A0A6P6P3X1_CARAU|nr:uncharacterized protein LOC113093992 [Carassius auratus]
MLVSNRLSLILLIFCGVFGAETDEIKTISVKTGDSVVLHTGVCEINREKQILWLFGAEDPDTLIAEIYKLSISIYDTYEGLKDRLQMDQQTGSLTIRNITTSHSGLYTAQIMNSMTTFKRFSVMVYDGGFSSAVMCSAENGPEVSLSWFKGRERLNQTSSPDLSVTLSLPLEIKDRNNDVFHCVAANPVSNKTTQFSFQEHCPLNTDSSHSCGFTEAVIRLVISALVGVATVAMLFYDVRS